MRLTPAFLVDRDGAGGAVEVCGGFVFEPSGLLPPPEAQENFLARILRIVLVGQPAAEEVHQAPGLRPEETRHRKGLVGPRGFGWGAGVKETVVHDFHVILFTPRKGAGEGPDGRLQKYSPTCRKTEWRN